MAAGAEAGRARTRRGQVTNNWLPVAGVGALFVGGAAAAVVHDGDTGRIAVYFVVSTLVLILLTAPWLVRNPPAMNATTGSYLVLAVCVELGALLGGAVEAFNGLGAWVVLGIGLAVYGRLEQGRVMVTAGVVAAVLGVVSIVVAVPWLTLTLALATSALIVFAAWRLRSLGLPGGSSARQAGRRGPASPSEE
jgi:membrane protein implicated in regulation of membrane protease activity